jgi:hypothetical protein
MDDLLKLENRFDINRREQIFILNLLNGVSLDCPDPVFIPSLDHLKPLFVVRLDDLLDIRKTWLQSPDF